MFDVLGVLLSAEAVLQELSEESMCGVHFIQDEMWLNCWIWSWHNEIANNKASHLVLLPEVYAIMEKEKGALDDEQAHFSFSPRHHLRNVSTRTKLVVLILVIVGIPYFLWNGPTNSIHVHSSSSVIDSTVHHESHGVVKRPGKLYPEPKNTEEETINLIHGLYELMEDMGYLKPNQISYPPHITTSINRTLTTELQLYDNVVDFMERLPYVKSTNNRQAQLTNWNGPGYHDIFLLSASFADLRDEETLRRSRNIWCSDQNIDLTAYPKEKQRLECRRNTDTTRKELPRDMLSLTVADHIYHYFYTEQRTGGVPRTGSLVLDPKRGKLCCASASCIDLVLTILHRLALRCRLGCSFPLGMEVPEQGHERKP